ncbi:Vps74 protein [Martiniozyma asiatica (nom. inval.)]|nr:Vps74 protein [Martiniozyma asiatica]
MSSGLSRRKGKKNSSDDEGDLDSINDKLNNISISNGNASNSKSYEKDNELGNENEESSAPVLTLLEEVLLIGLKDKEGYLSFWNDSISYALRGLILIELTLRNRIRMVSSPNRSRFELSDRLVEVISSKPTGETLLDEALKHMSSDSENLSVANWIDYLSGETWNLMKANYHLKQVRERLAKGLVDKGVLKTEMKSFLLFDMATHPINDPKAKRGVINRIINLLTARNVILDDGADDGTDKYFPSSMEWRLLRSVILVCACNAANVLENVLVELNFNQRDNAFQRAEELLSQYSSFPFVEKSSKSGLGVNLLTEVNKEVDRHAKWELNLELVAAVVDIFSKMDSIL